MYGPAEAVPLLQNTSGGIFGQAVKLCPGYKTPRRCIFQQAVKPCPFTKRLYSIHKTPLLTQRERGRTGGLGTLALLVGVHGGVGGVLQGFLVGAVLWVDGEADAG